MLLFWLISNSYCRISIWASHGQLAFYFLKNILSWYLKSLEDSTFAYNTLLSYSLVQFQFMLSDFKLGQKWTIGSHFISWKTYFVFILEKLQKIVLFTIHYYATLWCTFISYCWISNWAKNSRYCYFFGSFPHILSYLKSAQNCPIS